MAIFWYFTKLEITQVQNDLESWNLAKLWSIILSKIATRRFLIIWVFLEILPFSSKIWPFLRNFGQILDENGKIFENAQIIKNRCVAILDIAILHNLAKFQLSRLFWTWVISNFLKYLKIAILRFLQFFHLNWSKFSKWCTENS